VSNKIRETLKSRPWPESGWSATGKKKQPRTIEELRNAYFFSANLKRTHQLGDIGVVWGRYKSKFQ
jgi:hypothetical protein